MSERSSSGLSRAVHATASPRRGLAASGYERSAALRERRRLGTAALAAALGILVLTLFFLWERSKAQGVTYSHWGLLGRSAGDDYDEGAYVISAQLLLKGYALFHPVFSAQPAFFLPSLAAVIRAAGDPVTGGHIYEALYGMAALAAVFWMAWTAYRPLAGPLAAALLAVSPGFLLYAHAVEAEMPMLGLCALAVAAAQAYYLSNRRSMAALAGLLLMAGTEMKLLSVVVLLPLILLLCGGAWRGYEAGRPVRAIAVDALVFVLCLAVPPLLVLALLSPSEQWRQVITFHLVAGKGSTDLRANLSALRDFLAYDIGLLAAAAAGTIVGLSSVRRIAARGRSAPGDSRYLTLVYALWFLSTLLFLAQYHPLFQHQFVPLLPPLALLGAATATAWERLRLTPAPAALARGRAGASPDTVGEAAVRRRTGSLALPAAGYGLAAIGVAYIALLAFRTVPIDRHLFALPVTPRRDALIALLDRTTRVGDFVICDDPMVALGSRRLMPPEMADPSRVRTTAGYLTAAEAEAVTLRYRVTAIVASRPMFAIFLPRYLAWAGRHYHGISVPISGARVYLRPAVR